MSIRRPSIVVPDRYRLGQHFESLVQAQLASGRYSDASEGLRHALRLMEARERKLAELDAAIAESLADGEAGRVVDADEVFDALDARYATMAVELEVA